MGAIESPRIRRLRADYENVRKLAGNSDFIHIESIAGNPPEKYIIKFTCKGIAHIDSSQAPIISEEHKVKIELHKEYPVKAPYLVWMTDIFHPNFDGPKVCINDQFWSVEQKLEDLILMLGRMIQFQHFNVESKLDGIAASWAAAHRSILPIDNRPLYRGIKDPNSNTTNVIKINIK